MAALISSNALRSPGIADQYTAPGTIRTVAGLSEEIAVQASRRPALKVESGTYGLAGALPYTGPTTQRRSK
jgi:hypothetical protein